jgi:UDP-glucose:(heptosyl)LPS alpha-1,3-glucosyltransferase
VVVGFDRTLDMDLYRAGNACHRAWLERRRCLDGWAKGAVNRLNPLHPVVNFIERRIFLGSSSRVIAVLSDQGRRQIQRFYPVPDRQFAVLTPGVDAKRFHPGNRKRWRSEARDMLGVKEDIPLLLHVGSGFRIKALGVSIRALALLPRSLAKTVLVVAGKGNARPYLKLAKVLGVTDRVRFLGPVPDPERLYAAAELFVLPTYFDTFGQTVLESMASGVPVLVSDAAGASDIVAAKGGGKVLTSPVGPEAMADALTLLLSDPEALAGLGLEARGVAERYGLEAGLDAFVTLLDRISPASTR